MKKNIDLVSRIDFNYAAEQFFYYLSFCSLSGFTVIYLSYKGLTNTQIGYTSSAIAIVTTILQIVLSNYCDNHLRIPLKQIISIIYIFAIVLTASLNLFAVPVAIMIIILLNYPKKNSTIPLKRVIWIVYALVIVLMTTLNLIALPIALLIIVFTAVNAIQTGLMSLINAQMMQFNNAGIPAHFGWPRGMGSLSYASTAYLLGIMLEEYSPDFLIVVFLASAFITIICIMLMPIPPVLEKIENIVAEEPPNYFQMLRGNKTLIVFLIAVIVNAVGRTACFTFLIRIIENLGGGTRELGVSMFIQAGVELPMMFASTWILSRFLPKHIIVFSFICETIKVIGISLAPSIEFVYVTMALSIFCFGLFGFASVIFVNEIVKPLEKVRAQALVALCGSFGSIISNFYSGYVIDKLGVPVMLQISWIICGLGAVLVIICCRVHSKQFTTKKHNIEALK